MEQVRIGIIGLGIMGKLTAILTAIHKSLGTGQTESVLQPLSKQ